MMPAVDPAALAQLGAGMPQGAVQPQAMPVDPNALPPQPDPQAAPQTQDPVAILAQLYAQLETAKNNPQPGQDAVVHAHDVEQKQKEIDQVLKEHFSQGKAKAQFLKAGGTDLARDPATDFIRRTVQGG